MPSFDRTVSAPENIPPLSSKMAELCYILPNEFRYDRRVFSLLLTTEYAPFAVSFVVMLGIGIIEGASVLGVKLGLGSIFDFER